MRLSPSFAAIYVLSVLGLVGSPSGFGAAARVRISLPQAIEIALKNSTSVLKNENTVSLNGELVLRSYGQFLPDLGVNGSYGYSTGTNLYTINGLSLVNQNGTNTAFSIRSALNLFSGLSDYAGLKSALARRESSRYSLSWAKEQVELDIIQTYLQVILDDELVTIAEKNLESSNARLKLLQSETAVGAASRADRYRQQAQTSSDELLLSSSQARLNDDSTLLIRKLRIDPLKEYEFEIPPLEPQKSELTGKSLDELIGLAKSRRNDIHALKSYVTSSDWGITQAKSGYFPRLDFLFTRTAVGTSLSKQFLNGADVLPPNQASLFGQLGSQVTYAFSLNLTWSLFDRFITRYEVAAARTAWENSKIDRDDSELQAIADVRVAHSDYEIAQRQMISAETGLKAAKEAFDAITGRYSVGGASFLDVLSSQTALTQAQANQAQALVNLKLREKTLAYATGTLAP